MQHGATIFRLMKKAAPILATAPTNTEPATVAAVAAAGGYDRLFQHLPTHVTFPLDQDLADKLSAIGSARGGARDDPPPSSANNGGNVIDGIPAGYTYLGQFIIHDLTRSALLTAREGPTNRASSRLDLDSVYGDGPSGCPYLFQPAAAADDQSHLFHVGQTAPALQKELHDLPFGTPSDLPRHNGWAGDGHRPSCITPLAVDARNDENVIISQLQLLFLAIHNRVARYFHEDRHQSGAESFRSAQTFVVRCYQSIVVYDYLRRMLREDFYSDLLRQVPMIIANGSGPIPLEFVFGAARVPHAMSRQSYTINRHIGPDAGGLLKILSFSSRNPEAELPLPADWVIEWSHFFEFPDAQKVQLARRLSPFLAGPMVRSATGMPDKLPFDTVAFRDLWRSYQLDLASGQECAAQVPTAMPIRILRGSDILPKSPFSDLHATWALTPALNAFAPFLEATPLAYYLAQEAAILGNDGLTYGPLGSFIVATTFRRALTELDRRGGDKPWLFEAQPGPGVSTMPQFIKLLGCQDGELAAQVSTTCPELMQ